MIYVFGIMFAAILALGGLANCEHKKVGVLEASIAANKLEAKRMLVTEIQRGKVDAIQSQKDYDDALKTLSDRNKFYAGQLRDPGRRNGCPASTSAGAGVPQDATAGSELSPELGNFLRSEADRADVAATYAAKCRDHVLKPTIRSQVEALQK